MSDEHSSYKEEGHRDPLDDYEDGQNYQLNDHGEEQPDHLDGHGCEHEPPFEVLEDVSQVSLIVLCVKK